ncbi:MULTISPECIES: flagellar hook-associated protein FlgK [Leptospira]|uniref:Flagellar hook-associated protein 1 n=1 Tax=Leptospira saintgironsiae TaxID=2023183 RepID=A0A2M9YG10_9LEPT|nr:MULTISPECIES: flagellar hook-associated protein FlgK [Leptospira]PJZ50465.1 flagellar hook-associated protein FlgK [Leptospira saintgironsiae]TGK09301.1 flagellar hook-associated protein FlgK [Leptospira selangorensis]
MGSTFSGLEIGKRGLAAHQQALQTTGHNISNADNKHYSRQRVVLQATDPLYEPSLNRAHLPGQIGQGVEIGSIERVRDNFIDDRIIETSGVKDYWAAKNEYLYQAENIFNEPNGTTLRTLMDKFWSSWEELANYPEDNAHRSVVLEKAQGLGSRIEDVYRKLSQLRDQSNREIEAHALHLNTIGENIRTLNERIAKSEALGDRPNDLYDKRDALLQELSGLTDITIGRSDEDELMVFIGQQILVQGGKLNKVDILGNPSKDGLLDLYWKVTGDPVLLRKGRLQGLIEVRDKILGEKIDQVDALAINVMDVINEIHKDGFGLNGNTNQNFFDIRSLALNTFGEYDSDGDGQNDISAIFRVTGKNTLDPDRPVGISGTMTFLKPDEKETQVLIPYSANDTLNGIIKRINASKVGVVAYMNHDNQLAFKATVAEDSPKKNFILRHIEDSGELLVGLTGMLMASGPSGAYDYKRLGEITKLQSKPEDITLTPHFHPSSHFKVNEHIANNVANIAAARGKDVGGTGDYNSPGGHKDGRNALLVASSLRNNPVMVDYSKTTDDFYNSLISKLATEARESKQEFGIQSDLMTELENMRQSVMGVSLDEEMANMVQFQHSYNASAKMINTMNEILDTIINRLGA